MSKRRFILYNVNVLAGLLAGASLSSHPMLLALAIVMVVGSILFAVMVW